MKSVTVPLPEDLWEQVQVFMRNEQYDKPLDAIRAILWAGLGAVPQDAMLRYERQRAFYATHKWCMKEMLIAISDIKKRLSLSVELSDQQ